MRQRYSERARRRKAGGKKQGIDRGVKQSDQQRNVQTTTLASKDSTLVQDNIFLFFFFFFSFYTLLKYNDQQKITGWCDREWRDHQMKNTVHSNRNIVSNIFNIVIHFHKNSNKKKNPLLIFKLWRGSTLFWVVLSFETVWRVSRKPSFCSYLFPFLFPVMYKKKKEKGFSISNRELVQ